MPIDLVMDGDGDSKSDSEDLTRTPANVGQVKSGLLSSMFLSRALRVLRNERYTLGCIC